VCVETACRSSCIVFVVVGGGGSKGGRRRHSIVTEVGMLQQISETPQYKI
jgi:hypothetical protein